MNLDNIFFWRGIRKDYLRNFLYFLTVVLIAFFLFNIADISQEITQKELKESKNIKSNLDFHINFILDVEENIKYKSYGEYIWEIVLSLLQIVFLIAFMLMLYINE